MTTPQLAAILALEQRLRDAYAKCDGAKCNCPSWWHINTAAIDAIALAKQQQAELEALRKEAAEALFEMRHTVAPRHSFTDAVDRLDAALTQQTAGGEP